MNRFRFRLESVLRLRGAEETSRKRDLGIALRNVQEAERRRQAITGEIAERDRIAEELGTGRVTLVELHAAHRYSRLLAKSEQAHAQQVRDAEKAAEARRLELVEATRRKRTIELMRERALIEHRDAERREEQTELDDLTAVKYRPGKPNAD